MDYRQIGHSDLAVSEVCLGSWLTFGAAVDREQAVACVDRAFEAGINFFDTANVYGNGRAESFLGEVLGRRPRHSYYLATKAYFPMSGSGSGSAGSGLSAKQVRKQSEASLRRLGTDYVDLYQCHRYDEKVPLEETMAALTELVASGKARYIGFSEWTVDQVARALVMPGMARFVSSQPQYSLLWRRPEGHVIPFCAARGISQIAYSPLCQGVLTGKYRPGQPPPQGSRAADARSNRFMGRWRNDAVLEAVERLRPIAAGLGLSMAQLALAWVLREPNVASAIVGASRPQQVADNVAASGVTLDEATVAAMESAVGEVAVR